VETYLLRLIGALGIVTTVAQLPSVESEKPTTLVARILAEILSPTRRL